MSEVSVEVNLGKIANPRLSASKMEKGRFYLIDSIAYGLGIHDWLHRGDILYIQGGVVVTASGRTVCSREYTLWLDYIKVDQLPDGTTLTVGFKD